MMKFQIKKSINFLTLIFLFSFAIFPDSNYKVEKGDTLYSISRKYQITVAELRAANNLSESDVLKAGQKLVIPDADIGTAAALSTSKTGTTTSTAPGENKNTVKTTEITVQKGDTLYSISRKYGLSVADLLALNNLDSSDVIKVGQKLKVKQADTSGAAASVDGKKFSITTTSSSKTSDTAASPVTISATDKTPDTRTYGSTITAAAGTKWPVSNPKITQIKGKISGVQLSAKENEAVTCIHEGTVMYVGTYRGFGQVVFVQSKTGLIYAYTGLGAVKVKKGEYAVSGAELGSAGLDSISGKSQITFMVFQNGQPIDPGKAPRS